MKRISTILLFLMLVCMGAGATDATFNTGNTASGSNYSTGWFSVVAPITGSFTSFTLGLGDGSGGNITTYRTNAYLAISKDLKSSTTGFSESDFIAVSTNTCGTTAGSVTMTFTNVSLTGGRTYYFYFVTKSGTTYTTINQR